MKRPGSEGGGARPQAACGAQQSEHRTGEDVGEAFTLQPSRTGLCVEQRRHRLQSRPPRPPRTRPLASHDGPMRQQPAQPRAAHSRRAAAHIKDGRRPASARQRAMTQRAAVRKREGCAGLCSSPRQGMSAKARTRSSPVGSERHDAPRRSLSWQLNSSTSSKNRPSRPTGHRPQTRDRSATTATATATSSSAVPRDLCPSKPRETCLVFDMRRIDVGELGIRARRLQGAGRLCARCRRRAEQSVRRGQPLRSHADRGRKKAERGARLVLTAEPGQSSVCCSGALRFESASS